MSTLEASVTKRQQKQHRKSIPFQKRIKEMVNAPTQPTFHCQLLFYWGGTVRTGPA